MAGNTPWHPGEVAVQQRVGEDHLAARSAGAIRDLVPAVAADFLARQPLLVVAGTDASGDVWATMLTGPPGFLRVPAPDRLHVATRAPATDPLSAVLGTVGGLVGTIAIEPATRRRMRLNGHIAPVEVEGVCGLELIADQVVSNCPKYISARRPTGIPVGPGATARSSQGLSPDAAALLRRADTFFLATTDPDGNADASHRGGRAGFVEVAGDVVRWPEYRGNSMYLSLGNLEVQPRAGLLAVDFTTGDLVHVTGVASVDYDIAPGAGPMVEFTVDRTVVQPARTGLTWSAPEPSRFSPAV